MKYKNLINGKLMEPSTKEYFENINPADNTDVIGLFPKSGIEDIELAVESAKKTFPIWSNTTPIKRGEFVYKMGDLLLKNQEILAKVIVREMGKPINEAMGDIQSSVDIAYFIAGEGRRMYGQTTHSAHYRRWAITKRVPVGVCGLITAWNAPMAIITWKLFPAIICGNTVVLKPSEDTPLTAYLFGELTKEAGIPDGVVNIVYGAGAETGESLVKNKSVDLISFTGSTKVGRMISEECGRQIKKCSLELGGKNGLIVMDDADLDACVDAVVSGAFSTAGQRCASTSRVFVHRTIYNDFMTKLIDATEKFEMSCPIINKRQFDNIMNYISAGEKVFYGGKQLSHGKFSKGYFIEPTIFADIDIDSKLAQEEIFGPVLTVFKISSLDDAIEKVNSVDYGLTASIYTSYIISAMVALEKINVGCCYVNAPTFGSEPHMPFGGVKNSGNGSREPGTQSLDVFSEWKTIYIDYNGGHDEHKKP